MAASTPDSDLDDSDVDVDMHKALSNGLKPADAYARLVASVLHAI
jgi:hypothetical protein